MTAATYDTGKFGEEDMRIIAEKLESDNPMWIVVFGIYTREFVAFARFNAPSGRVIAAHYPGALPERMRQVEHGARLADRAQRGLLVA